MTSNREKTLIKHLKLQHLEIEAGLFSLLTESGLEVTSNDEPIPASNVIYLMLNSQEPVNYLQTLASDDHQILIEGGPADYYLFYPDGTSEKKTMGRDIDAGQSLIVSAPGGTAKAIVLHKQADYLLGASVVTPAWSPGRTTIGADDSFLQRYIGSSPWATEEKLKALIGPNFGHQVGGAAGVLELTVQTDGQIIYQSMQLSMAQVKSECRRFAKHAQGMAATLLTQKDAPREVVDEIRQVGETLGVKFTLN